MRRAILFSLFLGLTASLLWADNPSQMRQRKKMMQQLNQQMNEILNGTQVERKVGEVVKDLKWYDQLDEAEAQAKKTGKLVFWVHALATLDGQS